MTRNLQKLNHYKGFPEGAQFAKYHSNALIKFFNAFIKLVLCHTCNLG